MSADLSSHRYQSLALQVRCQAVNQLNVEAARLAIFSSIERIGRQISASKRFLGQDVRLVVLPEYVLTGFPWGEGASEWRAKAALDPTGPEYEALGRLAQDSNVFLAVNAYETDPHFPELYFQGQLVFAPSGDCILRYRRLISMYSPSPYDVWEAYLDAYGSDAIFPVADTEIGRLAPIASEEILYPEIARAFAVRGAEIFVHSSSEVGSPVATPKKVCRMARAIENLAYVVSANTAGIDGTDIPTEAADGWSAIVDYRGLVMAEANQGETTTANAAIDIAALRAYRRRPGMGNMLARQPMQLYADTYASRTIAPAGSLGQGKAPASPLFYRDRQMQVIERLDKAGLI
jgi:deaminated glutathione amidase